MKKWLKNIPHIKKFEIKKMRILLYNYKSTKSAIAVNRFLYWIKMQSHLVVSKKTSRDKSRPKPIQEPPDVKKKREALMVFWPSFKPKVKCFITVDIVSLCFLYLDAESFFAYGMVNRVHYQQMKKSVIFREMKMEMKQRDLDDQMSSLCGCDMGYNCNIHHFNDEDEHDNNDHPKKPGLYEREKQWDTDMKKFMKKCQKKVDPKDIDLDTLELEKLNLLSEEESEKYNEYWYFSITECEFFGSTSKKQQKCWQKKSNKLRMVHEPRQKTIQTKMKKSVQDLCNF